MDQFLNSAFMRKVKPETVPAKPLFDWFAAAKGRRALFSKATDYSQGRITNWESRGIPRGEVAAVAAEIGMSYEGFLTAAGVELPMNRHGSLSFGLRLEQEESVAIQKLREARPEWRRYVLGLATINLAAQETFLATMGTTVPDSAVRAAYGDVPDLRRSGEKK